MPDLRRQHRPRRLRPAGRQGPMDRPRRRFLPRRRGRRLRRCRPSQVRRRSTPRTASRRCNRAKSTCCRATPPGPRRATATLGLMFGRRHLLRRPGLHGAQEAQRRLGQGAQRRLGLRAAGHHDRAQPRRLFPRQQHEIRSPSPSRRGRDAEGLRVRPLRRLHDRCLGPLCRAPAPHQPRRAHRAARDHLQGAARPRRCARATTSGSTS